jgi:hypothetical protein
MKKIPLLMLAMAILLSACSEKTPMEKLESDTFYPDLTKSFWSDELTKKTDLWHEALPYCKAHLAKVNCVRLMHVYAVDNQRTILKAGSKKPIAYGSVSENQLKSPYPY